MQGLSKKEYLHTDKRFGIIFFPVTLFFLFSWHVLSAEGTTPRKKARITSAKASSCESSELGPEKAVDGNLQTRWASEFSDPQWFVVDLGERKTVESVILHWDAAYAEIY